MGAGNVTVIEGLHNKTFATGSNFDLHELGNFNIPGNAQVDIPLDLWGHFEEMRATARMPKLPSAEIQTLLTQRHIARAAQDWTTADSLRNQIEALGWQIMDTPQETILQPH